MNVPSARRLIALMRPQLVQHEAMLPYLRQIDQNRWYSNFGPLVQQLEARIAEFFGTGERSVVTVGNGTAGLTNILRAMNLPRGSICLLPSWTFAATPASVVAAGLVPYFIDVDANTWALDPEQVRAMAKALNGRVSAVMVVAPFGSPLNTADWDRLAEETGMAVIIDAAAAFDAFSSVHYSRPARAPVMISMHATKMFGIGEGGIVLSTNTGLVQRVREMSNFGFSSTKEIMVPGTNGKMSEYSAAMALATLDVWPQTRESWLCRKWYYAKEFAKVTALTGAHPWLSEEWVASTFNIHLRQDNVAEVIKQLAAAGIESRQWWGRGCHAHPAYARYPHGPLPVTEAFSDSVLALPFTLDIGAEDVAYIMQTLCEVLR